jgi:Domain of Unknown Function with PDB structure (DUF3857)
MMRIRAAALAFAVASPASLALADKLPPISKAEREMREVPNEPSAPAVFLIQRGRIHLRNFRFQDASSTIRVEARVKILKEEGKSRGEIAVPHSDYVRLSKFEGRTITPDGRVLKVDAKGKFKRKLSQTTRRNVTSIAFPGVEVGAILEYEYELNFDSYYYVEPWYFMDELPVLHSEVIWEVPNEMHSRVWTVPTFGAQVVPQQKPRTGYIEVTFTAKDLPSTPNEIYSHPFRDQAARVMVVPMAYKSEDENVPILESWAAVCEAVDKGYVRARRQSTEAAAKAAVLAAGKTGDDAAVALHRFVRDEIRNIEDTGPWIAEGTSVDRILANREGTPADKGLLLQAMLNAVGVDSQLLWAADWRRGRILADLPNPGAFDRVLVRTRREVGTGLLLDPVDASLAAGRLSPGYEGSVAVVHDPKAPETITLPLTSFVTHKRQASLQLAIDAEGRASGKGEMVLRGHHAWKESFPKRDAKETQDEWQKWADASLPGFKITGLKVEDKPDDGSLKVEWEMAATEESVLGDEVTLNPSRPIGPAKQPFLVNETQRRSPVIMDHGGIEEVELKLSWPPGWALAASPPPVFKEAGIASYRVEAKADPAANSLVFKRRMEIRKREPVDRAEFAALRNLFTEAEKLDAQGLVLARR